MIKNEVLRVMEKVDREGLTETEGEQYVWLQEQRKTHDGVSGRSERVCW